jgi:Trm5-related predicted tRNA methylase
MQIIQSKAKIKNGKIILESPPQELLNNQEIEVVIILKEPNKQEEFKEARQEMQTAFKEAGIETREQIFELIREVKLELINERDQ